LLVKNRSTFPVGIPIVACAKGIEVETLFFPYDILLDELPGKYSKYLAVLSGPSFAKEVIAKQPTSVTLSANNPATASLAQAMISSREYNFRVYTSDDIIGCEVAGAVKNVLAIAAGAAGGLGFGNNTRAMLVCRGLAELCRLAAKLGSSGKCLSGLAGVGDLMLTCSSELSRNYSVGRRLAQGEGIEEILASTQSVAEGVSTAEGLHALAERHGVEMPICTEVYRVLYQGKTITQALLDLTMRPLSAE
jgi:glycerol-3-phosphate dehydrogenase